MLFSCRNPLTRACYPSFAAEFDNDIRKRKNCLINEIGKLCFLHLFAGLHVDTMQKPFAGQKFGLQISFMSGAVSVTSPIVAEKLKAFQFLNS